MRIRNRSFLESFGSTATVGYVQDRTNPDFTDSSAKFVVTRNVSDILQKTSTIEDLEPNSHALGYSNKYGRKGRLRNSYTIPSPGHVSSIGVRGVQTLLPVKPCHHSQVLIRWESCPFWEVFALRYPGNPVFETAESISSAFPSVPFMLSYEMAFTPTTLNTFLSSSGSGYTTEAYLDHDWFHLADRFNETCDQFIPSSFLLGEDIAQNSIFIDAFKAVLNPTRAIKTFIDLGLRKWKRTKRMSLKHVARELAKDAADTSLFYQFGVKPAISDIGDALSAHMRVTDRLNYLKRHAGRYVPVRVMDVLSSGYENDPLPTLSVGNPSSLDWRVEAKTSTAVLGAYGRVREDLNWGSTWAAYLEYFGINKVVGLAWELIPFSFVVDWFTNAQERINSYTRLRLGGPFTELTGQWYSVKRSLTEVLFYTPGYVPWLDMNVTLPSEPTIIARRITSDYNRGPGIPDVSGVVDLSTLGLFHALTASSLIVQRHLR